MLWLESLTDYEKVYEMYAEIFKFPLLKNLLPCSNWENRLSWSSKV